MSRKKWTDLNKPPLSDPVLEVIKDMGFSLMTPVQVTTPNNICTYLYISSFKYI